MSELRNQIKKRDPFESPEQEAMLQVQRTADVLLRDAETLLKPAGLSPNAYNVLRILRGAAESLPCGEIADRMISRDPDMTRLLDRLSSRGLIERERDTHDRRVVRTRITEAGLKLLSELDEPIRKMHKDQLGHMSDAELRALIDLLEEAVRCASPHPSDSG